MPAQLSAPVWSADPHPAPSGHVTSPGEVADVAVVGAGVVGLTVARMLADRGARVVVLEAAQEVGLGVAGQSTGKVTIGHGLRLTRIRDMHGTGAAQEYADAARAGFDLLARAAAGRSWARVMPHLLYARDDEPVRDLARHLMHAGRLGLSGVERVPDAADVPVHDARAVVRYRDQLAVDPRRLVGELAHRAVAAGAELWTGVVVRDVTRDRPHRVMGDDGPLIAAHEVVLATHVPTLTRVPAVAVMEQRRHYAVAGRTDDPVPMSFDVGEGWSTRPHQYDDGSPGAVVVGSSHPTGAGNEAAAMHALRTWAGRHLRLDITHGWSSQDATSTDLLPLVGLAPLPRERVWFATGFGAWGLTTGAAAAVDLAGQILGDEPRWPSFRPVRWGIVRHPRRALAVSRRTVGSLVCPAASGGEPLMDLLPGQGAVIDEPDELVATSVDRDGRVHRVSARCTHLGCVVSWNHEAASWDCGCHGSRFAPDGRVLHGPAAHPLTRLPGTSLEPPADAGVHEAGRSDRR